MVSYSRIYPPSLRTVCEQHYLALKRLPTTLSVLATEVPDFLGTKLDVISTIEITEI